MGAATASPFRPRAAPGAGRAAEETTWPRLLLGLVAVYALFQAVAGALGSDYGQYGLLVGAVVVAAVLAVERGLFGQPPGRAARALGLGRPAPRGLLAAAVACLLLLLVFPAAAAVTGRGLAVDARWPWLVPGLFAQAGVAEEVLFRGYLFRRVRRGRSFGRAAAVASVPFVAVHLFLFLTLPWPIALASVLLATLISVPLAYLFELGGGTVWAPALLHFVVQGAIKVVTVEGAGTLLPLAWMAASAVVPWLVFLVPRSRRGDAG